MHEPQIDQITEDHHLAGKFTGTGIDMAIYYFTRMGLRYPAPPLAQANNNAQAPLAVHGFFQPIPMQQQVQNVPVVHLPVQTPPLATVVTLQERIQAALDDPEALMDIVNQLRTP